MWICLLRRGSKVGLTLKELDVVDETKRLKDKMPQKAGTSRLLISDQDCTIFSLEYSLLPILVSCVKEKEPHGGQLDCLKYVGISGATICKLLSAKGQTDSLRSIG